MHLRDFGTTGLQVSALGYGAGHIGDPALSEAEVERLLGAVLDAGVTLIDTARGYGLSEERVGRHLRHRRDAFVLSTKVGYGVEGFEDWTGPCVAAGIDLALRLLQTDRIDLAHLHSCDAATLRRDDVLRALEDAVQAGKVRVPAYSGDNHDLAAAIDTHRFGGVQASINVCDQHALIHHLHRAKEQGLGVIAKRPVANAPWRFEQRPVGHYGEPYWARWRAMGLDDLGVEPRELALRFVAWTWGVDSCIVGTTNIDHLRANADVIDRGPLPDDVVSEVRRRFQEAEQGWVGLT